MKWIALVFLVACGKPADNGPSCDKVMDHVLDLMKSTQGGHGGMNLGSREAMISTCEQRHMPKEVRYCMMNSKDITHLANCSRMNPHPPAVPTAGSAVMPIAPTPPVAPPPPAPVAPPAGSGTPAP